MMGRRMLFISKWPPRLHQRGLQNATATHVSNASASVHSGVVATSLTTITAATPAPARASALTLTAAIATATRTAKVKQTAVSGSVARAGGIGTSVAAAAAAAHSLAISCRNLSSIIKSSSNSSSISRSRSRSRSIRSGIATGSGRQRGMATTGAAARLPRIGGLHDFILRTRVLTLWRDILRATRNIENPNERKGLRDWARQEFERNRSVRDSVSFPDGFHPIPIRKKNLPKTISCTCYN